MRRSAGLLLPAACALGASAFLIPAGLPPPSNADTLTFSVPVLDPKNQSIQLQCSSCVFPSTDRAAHSVETLDDLFWIQGGSNSLVLEFTVSDDGERLFLNGETVYPMHLSEAEASPHVYVPQIPSSSSIEAYRANEVQATLLEVTGSLVMIREQAITEGGDLVIPLTYSIVELERQAMTVDDVFVKMLKTSDGQLLILEVTNVPDSSGEELPPPPSPPSVDFVLPSLLPGLMEVDDEAADLTLPPPAEIELAECNTLCRLKLAIASRVMELQQGRLADCEEQSLPAMRHHLDEVRLPTHIRPHFLRAGPDGEPRRHNGRPHHARPHHYHHRHHHHHHFIHAFIRGVAAVLIPTLAGIAVGMAVSLLGLFVGRLIGFIWIQVVRGGRRGYASVSLEEGDANKDYSGDEEDMEPLPVYEEAPAYEDAIAEQK